MKAIHWIIFVIIIMASAWLIMRTADTEPRIENTIDLNWRFTMEDDSAFSTVDFDDSGWRVLSLPHDWMIEQPVSKDNESTFYGGYYPGGIGWYRKKLELDSYEKMDQFYLAFEGVYRNAEVWINGHYLGRKKYGYIGFDYDISAHVRKDTVNVIAVRTDCSDVPSDRWYSGAGIYRHVNLIASGKLHFPVLNSRITTRNDSTGHVVVSEIEIKNNDRRPRRFKIRSDLLSPDGSLLSSSVSSRSIEGNSTILLSDEHVIQEARLWSVDDPAQYVILTYMLKRRKVIDNLENRFGIRDVEFRPDSGFMLNGQKVWLKGVCIHHDGGALGAAVPDATWEYRLSALKNLGVNAVRLAHNPHSPEVLEICDKLGLLVIDEIYDKWEMTWPGTKGDFDFPGTFEEDLTYFIKRDVNHPSVIAWSLGNETVEQLENPQSGVEWYNRLVNVVRKVDDSRMVTCALHPAYPDRNQEIPSSYIYVEPLISYNYRTDSFASWHEQYPDRIWLASETKVYNESKPEDFSDISYADNSWLDMEPFMAGQFIWAGIDYLGESAGWPFKKFYNGLLKTTAEAKPFAYYTQSIYSEEPMVKIVVVDQRLIDSLNNFQSWQKPWSGPPVVRHWNFKKEVDDLQVIVYTNCPEVELEVNGDFAGRLRKKDFNDGVIKTNVNYEEGIIRARAYFKAGSGDMNYVSDSLRTAFPPSRIMMEPDKMLLLANGQDVVHIETRVTDSIGTTYPDANHMINYEVRGPGKVRVIDNGDPKDHTPYGSMSQRVYKGSQLVIIQSTLDPGDLIISASANGLKPASVNLKSIPGDSK